MSHTERIRAQARRDHGASWEWDRARSEPKVWEDWEVELIKRLWPRGYTGSELAGELNCTRTRSSILAKVRRLGLCRSGHG
jgi:hypothetical protein